MTASPFLLSAITKDLLGRGRQLMEDLLRISIHSNPDVIRTIALLFMRQNVRHDRFLANDGTTFDDCLVAAPGNFGVLDHKRRFGRSGNNRGIERSAWLKDEINAVEMSGR